MRDGHCRSLSGENRPLGWLFLFHPLAPETPLGRAAIGGLTGFSAIAIIFVGCPKAAKHQVKEVDGHEAM
jgi:hypothetical protein